MSIKMLQDLNRRWRDSWLPQDCFLCDAALTTGFLCGDCAASLKPLAAIRCPICARPTPLAVPCGACLKHPPHFDASQALWRYEFPLDRLIHSLKYAHRLACCEFFAQALMDGLEVSRPDLILPVPLSAQRLRERGFNQAVEIAKPLARHWRVPLELHAVRRRHQTIPQAALPWKERTKNMRGAFDCALDLTGKFVLVIDDVMTTGATLDELARTLKHHGAARVENCLLARAVLE